MENLFMGDLRVTAVEGNLQRLDGGAMFGNAPRTVWEKWIAPDSLGRIPLNCRSMLLECDGEKILCETGIGNFFEPKLAERYGIVDSGHRLIENLNQLGIDHSEIDFVILSHLHFDHAGGLLPSWKDRQCGGDSLLFPKAKYVVSRTAFERAKAPHPRDRASFIPELPDLLERSGRLLLINDCERGEKLPSFISFIYSHGHTPGHMHTVAHANGKSIVFAGDLIPGKAWVHLPITMGYDRFAEQVIDEKKAFYTKFANEDSFVFFTHDSTCAMSKIRLNAAKKFEAYADVERPVRFTI
jgi:glyoxylase-like metal-dependent hydrolase (beta-lactamase superfamily II)